MTEQCRNSATSREASDPQPRIHIVDIGAPTSRAMREASALVPHSVRLDDTICVNPFDPKLWREFEALQDAPNIAEHAAEQVHAVGQAE